MVIDVVDLVQVAFLGALGRPDVGNDRRSNHQHRSLGFVDEIAEYFRRRRAENEHVLARSSSGHRADFGLNELLFDVLVCQCASTRAAVADKELLFVSRGLWAVESEFARDSRHALRDFQKLVLADCENKLFIGPLEDEAAFRRPLGDVAAHCGGATYAAFVPHPATWDNLRASDAHAIRVYAWVNGAWQQISSYS